MGYSALLVYIELESIPVRYLFFGFETIPKPSRSKFQNQYQNQNPAEVSFESNTNTKTQQKLFQNQYQNPKDAASKPKHRKFLGKDFDTDTDPNKK